MSDLRHLTGKQRYWQVVRRARMAAARDWRAFVAGQRPDHGLPGMARERDALIAEFDRMQRALDEARQ